MKIKSYFSAMLVFLVLTLAACSNGVTNEKDPVADEDSSETITDEEMDQMFGDDEDEETTSPYTEEELKGDPTAPSSDTDDYNSDGEYVPADGPTDNPADYNSDGEYKPVEDMTQEEIQAELEEMLGN